MTKATLIAEWIAIAQKDLATAQFLTGMRPEPIEIICFHCQQAAEKAIKAYLVHLDIRPPKTHDLIELITLCDQAEHLRGLSEKAFNLNDYSVLSRYPGSHEIIDKDKIEALQSAESILNMVLVLIQKD